jgi:hypothetical protein
MFARKLLISKVSKKPRFRHYEWSFRSETKSEMTRETDQTDLTRETDLTGFKNLLGL